MKRVFEHPPEAADREALLAQPRRAERHAGISRLARTRISRGRRAAGRRRMVAARFLETDGSVDGAGRLWPDQLSPAGSASRSVYEERRVGDSRASLSFMRPRCRGAPARFRWWSRRTMAGRPRSMAIRCIRRAAAQPTPSRRLRILDLYDPARSNVRRVTVAARKRQTRDADRAAFEKYLEQLRSKLAADGGAGLAFLVEETHSPTRERLRAELEKAFPQDALVRLRPAAERSAKFRTQMSFGDNSRLVPRLERADVVLALDSDFLDCGEGDLAAVRAFSVRGAG